MAFCPDSVQKQVSSLLGKNVPRGTFLDLSRFVDYVLAENQKYNVMGPREAEKIWDRHVLDSAQLIPFLGDARSFLDVGSGAGFPGMVLSLLGAKGGCLLEASQKKALFLKNVPRGTFSDVRVVCGRLEVFRSDPFDVIVSRAVAPVVSLLKWSRFCSSETTRYLFLKSAAVDSEICVAQETFSFEWDIFPSITSSLGRILEVRRVVKRENL